MALDMTQNLRLAIEQMLQRAPLWVRRDMASSDNSIRERAEEALAAMIASELQGQADERENPPLTSPGLEDQPPSF